MSLTIATEAPSFDLPGVDGRNHSLDDYADAPILAVVGSLTAGDSALIATSTMIRTANAGSCTLRRSAPATRSTASTTD